jgi:hypothetical protein
VSSFQIRGAGVLDLVVPGIRALRLSGPPAPVIAQSWTEDGVRSDVTVPPDGVTVTIPHQATLSQLSVTG